MPRAERVLVTGAQGFVGRFLVAELLRERRDLRIIGTGRSAQSNFFTHDVTRGNERIRAPLTPELRAAQRDKRYEYVSADIRDPGETGALLERLRPQIVYHLASGLRDDDPGHLFGTNVLGTIALLEAVKRCDETACVVLGSSGSVYGAVNRVPIGEDEACEPRDHYAASKLASEHVARITLASSAVRLVSARIFNIAGPGQEERHAVGRFASQVAAIASGAAAPRVEVGDLTTTRDFVDVRDVARSLIALAEAESGIYNVGSGVETRISEILEVLLRVAGLDGRVQIEQRYTRAADIPRLVADIGRLRRAGYAPSYSFERTVRDVFEYYCGLPAPSDRAEQHRR